MRQASFKSEMAKLKLKSSAKFLCLQLSEAAKIGDKTTFLRSSKIKWSQICDHSGIPVKQGGHRRLPKASLAAVAVPWPTLYLRSVMQTILILIPMYIIAFLPFFVTTSMACDGNG